MVSYIPGTRIPKQGSSPTISGTKLVSREEQDITSKEISSKPVSIIRGSSGSSSRSSSVSVSKPVSYSSSLLQKSFSSKEAMQKAEAKYKRQQQQDALKAFSMTGGTTRVAKQNQFFDVSKQPSVINKIEEEKRKTINRGLAPSLAQVTKTATRKQTIEESIRGKGAEKITTDLVIKSLKEKGIDTRKMSGLNQETAIEAERQRLSTSALTSPQRERLGTYGMVLGAGTAVASIPISAGAGLLGLGLLTPPAVKQGAVEIERASGQEVLPLNVRQRIVRQASEAASKEVQKKGALASIGQEIIPIFNYDPSVQSAFRSSVIEGLKKEGITGARATELADRISTREQVLGGIAEVGALAIASGGTEIIGQRGVRFFLKKDLAKQGLKLSSSGGLFKQVGKQVTTGALTKKQAANIITKSAFKGIAPAGAVEGASFEVIQSIARNRDVDVQRLGLASATGALSAGVLGAGIARFAITRPFTGKTLQRGLYLIDPTEKPGDVIGGRLLARQGVPDIRLPVVSQSSGFVPSTTFTPAFTPTQTKTKGGKKKAGVSSFFPISSFVPTQTPTPTQTKTPTKTKTKTQGFVPTPTSPFVPTQTLTPTQTPVQEQTPTPTQTQTSVMTPTFTTAVSVPVFTAPQGFFPPLFGGFGGTGRRGSKRVRVTYFNELQKSLKLFSKQIGGVKRG